MKEKGRIVILKLRIEIFEKRMREQQFNDGYKKRLQISIKLYQPNGKLLRLFNNLKMSV